MVSITTEITTILQITTYPESNKSEFNLKNKTTILKLESLDRDLQVFHSLPLGWANLDELRKTILDLELTTHFLLSM